MTNNPTPTRPEVEFRFFRLNGEEVTGSTETVEDAILGYRRELRRRARLDRADRGTLQYRLPGGEWISAR